MITVTFLILFFLCWGSFLNVLAYRLIHEKSLIGRSSCIHCDTPLAWYDILPLFSYLMLQGTCRHCQQPISFLYPFIELLTGITLSLLYCTTDLEYFGAYFIFFSALIVTIRTDLETMLISRWVTAALLPLGLLCSLTDRIPILPLNSILGAAVGYGSLWLVGTIFYAITKKHGIGEGDFELLAMIGSFTGIIGIWASVLFGSLLGTIIGLTYLKYTGMLQRYAKLPFGPFLAGGAILYVLVQEPIMHLIMGIS